MKILFFVSLFLVLPNQVFAGMYKCVSKDNSVYISIARFSFDGPNPIRGALILGNSIFDEKIKLECQLTPQDRNTVACSGSYGTTVYDIVVRDNEDPSIPSTGRLFRSHGGIAGMTKPVLVAEVPCLKK